MTWWSGLLIGAATWGLACSDESTPDAGSAGSAGQGTAGQGTAGATAQGGGAGASSGSGGSSAGNQTGGTAAGMGGSAGTAGAAAGSAGEAAGGSGGMSGAGGSGGSSSAMPSKGCNIPAEQELNKWVEQPKLNVSGVDRQWWVWLPTDYDPKRAYPLVFNFHGCGSSDNIVPMQRVAGDDAILVRAAGISNNTCYDSSPNGNDVKFFDQMLEELLGKRCVDSSRVFATGYSSGSWLTNTLECVRGDKLRATGTVSGGRSGGNNNCKGKFARIFIHDRSDMDNTIEMGNDAERARLVTQNNCSNETMPYDPAPCVAHQGCDPGYPVIWCQTTDKGHARQDAMAPDAFWKLFSSL